MKSNDIKKIVFLGSPEIGAIVLLDLLKMGIKISQVITRPDKPKGRGKLPEKTAVKIVAEKKGISIFEPNTKDELTETLVKIVPDLCIVAAYGMIIPSEALEIPKYGMINFHPSLLPELRGPAPIPMSIMCGYKKTGVSIIKISQKMDAGDILAQKEVTLTGGETTPELSEKLAHLGAKMIFEILPKIYAGNLKPLKQDETKVTYTKMIKKEDGEIFFQKYCAQNIEQAARAFMPWPGVYFHFKGKKVDLYDIEIIDGDYEPGKVYKEREKVIIGTKKKAISPKYFKIEGKKKIKADDFARGYSEFVGTRLP